MKSELKNFVLQVKSKNGEHEQALLRVFFTVVLYSYLIPSADPGVQDKLTLTILGGCALFVALVLMLHLLYRPKLNNTRIAISIIADMGAATCGMLVLQESGVIFYGVYLWVVVGNGLRYGVKALVFSYISSLIGFATVVYFNTFWSEHIYLMLGLFAPLFLVPLYIIKLRNQLNDAVEAATEASMAKSHFLAHMSHEMRTPLNGIIGANDLLIATELNAEQRDLANTLENSSRILRQMVDNVLDISKIESGKLVSERADFDLHELVNNTITMFHTQAQEKGLALTVHFTPDTPFALHGDVQHLLQVIVNLLGNALKFTHVGSVALRVSKTSQDSLHTTIKFEISDTGIGIAGDVQHGIFERFTQADASIALQYGGTGLGTTISRDLVKLMGGTIGLHSQLGVGSVFWFELPFVQQTWSDSQSLPQSLAQLQVLSVGLRQQERTVLASYLASWAVRYENVEAFPHLSARLTQLYAQRENAVVVMLAPAHLGWSEAECLRQLTLVPPSNKSALILLKTDTQCAADADDAYACVLHFPLDKTLLFNALHSVLSPRHLPGVISFKEHYQRSQSSKSGVRILLADDNATNRKIIAKILEHGGHYVEVVNDGELALEALENQHFDLMVLDMNMPYLGGIEVTKIHRATQRETATPVIILTANATLAAARDCEEAQVDAYLTKPVNALTLLDTVARLTRRGEVGVPLSGASSIVTQSDTGELMNENTLYQLGLLAGGQGSFLAEVIHGFISETERLLEAMQIALTRQEYATFKDLAHIVEGSAGNVGGNALHHLCRQMIRCNHADLQRHGGDLLKQAQVCFASTQNVLMQHLENTARVAV